MALGGEPIAGTLRTWTGIPLLQLVRLEAEVPLSEMFGYATVLRSATQGKAEFTMEFLKYGKVPNSIREELIEKFASRKKS